MYKNYETMAKELDEILDKCEINENKQDYSKDEILKSIRISNKKLEKEFEVVDKIRTESLKAALSEEIFL